MNQIIVLPWSRIPFRETFLWLADEPFAAYASNTSLTILYYHQILSSWCFDYSLRMNSYANFSRRLARVSCQ